MTAQQEREAIVKWLLRVARRIEAESFGLKSYARIQADARWMAIDGLVTLIERGDHLTHQESKT